MITYEWDFDDLSYVQRKLGAMKSEARKVLKNAVNKTAVSARVKLRQEAQKRYTAKTAGINSRIDISRATIASPTATLNVKGKTLTMPRFRTTAPKSGVKAEVLKGTGLKTVEGSKNIKAFVSKVASGNKKSGKVTMTTQILQRVGKERYPLKVLRSPSVPKMIEMVYDGKQITSTPLKQEIERLYRHYVDQEIERTLNSK
jgi:hypothetical protein